MGQDPLKDKGILTSAFVVGRSSLITLGVWEAQTQVEGWGCVFLSSGQWGAMVWQICAGVWVEPIAPVQPEASFCVCFLLANRSLTITAPG